MSYEDIQKVMDAERSAKDEKAAAQAQAKQIIAAAEKAGTAAVEKARAEAEADAIQLLAQAEAQAKAQSEQTLAANAQACAGMKSQARTHLEEAADLIVRRVVNL